MLPFWHALGTRPAAQAAMRGTNAAVVGMLGAALYNPVWTNAVQTQQDCTRAGRLPSTHRLEAVALDRGRAAGRSRHDFWFV
jgi:hypothetical protein